MRHPPIEALFQDVLANPSSSSLRAWIRANDGFEVPVPVHLPSGAVVMRRIEEDPDASRSWMGPGAASIRHKGARLWVSGLPLSPDQPHKVILAAWDPYLVLEGRPAAEVPKPGVAVQLVTRPQAEMLLKGMELPPDIDAAALVRTAVKTGRARVKTGTGRTVTLEPVKPPSDPVVSKPSPLVRMCIWPERGVKPGVVFGTPPFEDLADATLALRERPRGLAVRVPELDRVGQCLFIEARDIHYLRLGVHARAMAVDFRYLTEIGPADDYSRVSVAIYRDLRSKLKPGQSLEAVTREPVTEEDRDWARARLPALFEALAVGVETGRCPVVAGWTQVREDLEEGYDGSWLRGYFGAAGWGAARNRLTDAEHLEDFDHLTGFWPRERFTLVQDALKAQLADAAPRDEEPGLGF